MTRSRPPIKPQRASRRGRGRGLGEPAPHPVPTAPEPEQPWLLDSHDVARLLGIGRTKTFQMMATAELPTVRIGRCVRVPREALLLWISRQVAPEPGAEPVSWLRNASSKSGDR
jgi:excisionase family DNA binding protein